MRAILTINITEAMSLYDIDSLVNKRTKLLEFLRSNNSPDTYCGLCTNFDLAPIVRAVTGTDYPIKGRPFMTNMREYSLHRAYGSLYKNNQLKQRRKLVRKVINVITQYLMEKGYEV